MSFNKILATNNSWGLLALRLAAGAIFISHGAGKVGIIDGPGIEGVTGMVAGLGFPMPGLFAILLAASEFVGGILLVLGFLTRFAAFTQVIAMLVAVFMVHWANGLSGPGGYEFAMLLGVAAFTLMLDGAGRFSVDRMLSGKN